MSAPKNICWDCMDMWDVEVELKEEVVYIEGGEDRAVVVWCPYCERIKMEQK